MAQKKDRDYSKPFTPPRVVVRLVEGDNLAHATQSVSDAANAETRRQAAEVEAQRQALAPEAEKARALLDQLGAWESEHAEDLKLLRSMQFDSIRGRVDEAARVRTANRIVSLFTILQQLHEQLKAVAPRIERLTPDSIAPRVFMADPQFPTVPTRDGWMPREPTQIRLSVARAAQTMENLPKILQDAKDSVTGLAAALERANALRGDVPPPTAQIIDPDELARRAASRPGNVQTKADYVHPRT